MNIFESITAIMQEIPAIGKEKKNQQQGFKYRGIDDVMNALQPILSKYKVFVVPEVIDQSREERVTNKGGTILYSMLKIRYTFYAEDGTSFSAVVIGEGMDSGDKSSNKAMAIAMKYAFFQVFCIPTEEMKDPDAETPEPSRPKEPAIPTRQKPGYRLPPQGDATVICERCGGQVMDYFDGRAMVKAARLAARAKELYGHALCEKCVAEAKKCVAEATEANDAAG